MAGLYHIAAQLQPVLQFRHRGDTGHIHGLQAGDETLPDIRQSKKLALLYHVTLDELVDFDLEVKEIQDVIQRTSEETQQKIDWTKMWADKYPVLATYQQTVQTENYTETLRALLARLRQDYGYNRQDAFLVLKDILAQIWNNQP